MTQNTLTAPLDSNAASADQPGTSLSKKASSSAPGTHYAVYGTSDALRRRTEARRRLEDRQMLRELGLLEP